MAYLHGVAPAVVVSLLLFGGVGLSVWQLSSRTLFRWSSVRVVYVSSSWYCSMWLSVLWMLAVVLVHGTVILTVNVGYVLTVLRGLPSVSQLLLQISLSLFKLTWNLLFVTRAANTVDPRLISPMLLSLFLKLFTFVATLASPVIATFFSDSNCFEYVIAGQASNIATFDVPLFGCFTSFANGFDLNLCGMRILPVVPVVTSVEPNWFYSYQCSPRIDVHGSESVAAG